MPKNIAGVLLSCIGLWCALWGPFGLRVATGFGGFLLFILSAILLIDLPEGDA